ncbi:ABC transporter substrate-binding protein [Arcobacter sp. 7ABA8]|uniref:ABC transporter substrate-binding protein n=2 Tax=unclassified Arcobacter TaxID=2593671 RepID=UPI003C7864CC
MRLIFISILIIISFETLSAKALKKVSLQLSWFDQFQFAGYYIAKEKGYYENLGLDVEIKPFNFGIHAPKEVDEGKADFGIGRETLILDRAKGKKIVALYSLFQSTPLILITTNKNINKVEDFVNKKIMTTDDDSSEVSIKAMISSKKVKFEQLHFIKHTHNINDLINKKTDIISAYISKSPFDLVERGIQYKIFDPKDYGFDMYSDFLFTSEDMINNHFATVAAFKKASLKGWEYAYSHIEETANLISKKYNSQHITKKALIFEGEELKKLSYQDTKILGEIKEDKVQRIYDLYNVMGLIPKKTDAKKFVYYTNDNKKIFLSKEEISYLNKNNKFKMCIIPNIKPYSYFEKNEFKGFIADYFKIIKEKAGMEFEVIKDDKFKNYVDLFKNKKCDIFASLEKTKEREKYANFTKPYVNIPFVLITKQNFPFVDSLSTLKNKKIGINASYNISKRVKEKYPDIQFIGVESLDEGIKKVLNNKIDGHVDLLYTTLYRLYDDNSNLKISNKLDIDSNLRVAVRKENKILFEIISRAVNDIDDAKIEALIKSWVTIEYKKSTDFTYLWITLFIAGVIFLAFMYRHKVLSGMNKSLNDKVKQKTEELLKINSELEKRINEEVEKNLKKDHLLQRQSKLASMGEMLENIAHQWRQPLSVITMGASGIKLKKELELLDDSFLTDTLESILKSSSYLSQTIDDFKYFFKPSKDKDKFSLESCFEKSLNVLSLKLNNEKITIIKNIEKVEIVGYESELVHVFINILNNAKDAFCEAKVNKRIIFLDILKEKSKIVIKIKDNAGGINSSIIDKIFDPYFTTKHKSQGTGIGLYMSHQIITKHMDGQIEVSNSKYEYENEKYKGALFTITFYGE